MFSDKLAATFVVAVAVTGAMLGVATPASAAPKVALGGGSGIVMQSGPGQATLCTLGAIGHDRKQNLVGITASSCAAHVNQGVFAGSRSTPVGKYMAINPKIGYAVIALNPDMVRPVRVAGGVTIAGAAPAPGIAQIVCKSGVSSGVDCGPTLGQPLPNPHRGEVLATACSVGADAGGPVVAGDRLVGIVAGDRPIQVGPVGIDLPCPGIGGPLHNPLWSADIMTILNDMNHTGGFGAGFRIA